MVSRRPARTCSKLPSPTRSSRCSITLWSRHHVRRQMPSASGVVPCTAVCACWPLRPRMPNTQEYGACGPMWHSSSAHARFCDATPVHRGRTLVEDDYLPCCEADQPPGRHLAGALARRDDGWDRTESRRHDGPSRSAFIATSATVAAVTAATDHRCVLCPPPRMRIRRWGTLAEVLKNSQQIFGMCFHEIVRQVSTQCTERGQLMVCLARV